MLREKAFNNQKVSTTSFRCLSLASCNRIVARGGSSLCSWQPAVASHCKTATTARISLGFDQPKAPPRQSRLQPCRARKSDLPELPSNMGSALVREITRSIRECTRLQELEDIVDEWGSSFDYIHTAAAFVKAAKLVENRPTRASGVAAKSVLIWEQQYGGSGTQGLANVLWASSKLQLKDPDLWSKTLQAFLQDGGISNLQHLANVVYAIAVISSANRGMVPGLSKEQVQQSITSLVEQTYILITHPVLHATFSPQVVANILWSCAKLRFSIQKQELAALVKAVSRPDMVEASDAQVLANSIYALSELHQVCDMHLAINERLWGSMLHTTVVEKIANSSPQHVSNTVLALARLATDSKPAISQALAQGCATRLLNGRVAANVGVWNSQDCSNVLYAYAKLQLEHKPFLDALVIALPNCIPKASLPALTQIAWACASLSLPVHCMADVLARSRQLIARANRNVFDVNDTGLVAVVSSSIAKLDLQLLAADVVGLVCTPSVQKKFALRLLLGDASMLWQVHAWLVDKELLDSKGLSRCLTPEQLAICQKADEAYLNRLAGQ